MPLHHLGTKNDLTPFLNKEKKTIKTVQQESKMSRIAEKLIRIFSVSSFLSRAEDITDLTYL